MERLNATEPYESTAGLHFVGILYGMTATELQSKPGVPIFLKKRDLLDINDIEVYFEQLRARVNTNTTDNGGGQ